MARKKKDGLRAKNIQGKGGKLYITTSKLIIVDGKKKYKIIWTATGLDDTKENLPKAIAIRDKAYTSTENTLTVDKSVRMSELVDQFLSVKKRSIADTTYSSYVFRGEHIKAFFGEIRVTSIKTSDIEAFYDYLVTNKDLQRRTIKDIKNLLNSVMEYAVRNSVIISNPVEDAEFNKMLGATTKKAKNNDENFFTYDEALKFLELIEKNELYELYYLTIYFGLRREELLGLKWSCVDFKRKEMTINHTVTVGTQVNRLDETKTEASNRTYPLSDDVIALLANLRAKESENRKLFGSAYQDNDYIFKHDDGTLYYPQYPTKAFSKLLKHLSGAVPTDITFHGLRTSCVSILVHAGYDVKYIQKWVGHKSIDTTLKYYTKAKDSEAKEKLSDGMAKLLPSKYNHSNHEGE